MSVTWNWTTVTSMPPALILLAALSVPATLDLREMESTAQVSMHGLEDVSSCSVDYQVLLQLIQAVYTRGSILCNLCLTIVYTNCIILGKLRLQLKQQTMEGGQLH